MLESIAGSVREEWMRLSISVVAALGLSSELGVSRVDKDGILAEKADGDGMLGNGTV